MYSTRYDGVAKVWYGPDIPPLYNPNMNLAQALLSSMSIFGSKVAQVLEKRMNRIKRNLKKTEKLAQIYCFR